MIFAKFTRDKKALQKRFLLDTPTVVISVLVGVFIYVIGFSNFFTIEYSKLDAEIVLAKAKKLIEPPTPKLDRDEYNKRMLALAHINVASTTTDTSTTTPPGMTLIRPGTDTESVSVPGAWPVKTVYPQAGALLPFNRILAYYGNFYSPGMGALGEYPEEEMLTRLQAEVKNWADADPTTPVIPAIHYIVVTAQGSAGKDGKYRLRMPDDQIDHALRLAEKVQGIVFLDFQVALSNLETELPLYEEYFKKPNVHLGIDPEFSMKTGAKPGTIIGSFDAVDINYAATYLAGLVKEHHLPPKVLVVHRFTEDMVTNYKNITPLPEVQIVMHMDGWGFGAKKINTYNHVIYPEPVQFTGFKIFYKNDMKPPSTRLLTPEEVLELTPSPSYIQYQ